MNKAAPVTFALILATVFAPGSSWADSPEAETVVVDAPRSMLDGPITWTIVPGEGLRSQLRTPEALPRPTPREPQAPEVRWTIDLPVVTCLAQGSDAADVCGQGREISRMQPCLEADDCPAYDAWRKIYGEPRVMPLESGPRIVPAGPTPTEDDE